jgi:hypothetical protein
MAEDLPFQRKPLRKKKEGIEQELPKAEELEFIWVVRSLRTGINISSTLEDIPLREGARRRSLKLPKPEGPKRTTVVDLWGTHVDRSSSSGKITLGEGEEFRIETPEARKEKSIVAIDLRGGHTLIDWEIRERMLKEDRGHWLEVDQGRKRTIL